MISSKELYTGTSGARASGIAVATFSRRAEQLGIKAVATLVSGSRKQPLFDAAAVAAIGLPFLAARSTTQYTLTDKTSGEVQVVKSKVVAPSMIGASDAQIEKAIQRGDIADPLNPNAVNRNFPA